MESDDARSMRSMAGSRSQLKAMSVAFDDHQEIVDARRDREQFPLVFADRDFFQQLGRRLGALVGRQRALLRNDVPVIGGHRFDVRHRRRKAGEQALQAESRKGGVALGSQECRPWNGDFWLGGEAERIPDQGMGTGPARRICCTDRHLAA